MKKILKKILLIVFLLICCYQRFSYADLIAVDPDLYNLYRNRTSNDITHSNTTNINSTTNDTTHSSTTNINSTTNDTTSSNTTNLNKTNTTNANSTTKGTVDSNTTNLNKTNTANGNATTERNDNAILIALAISGVLVVVTIVTSIIVLKKSKGNREE